MHLLAQTALHCEQQKHTAWKEELCLYYKMDAVLILKIRTGNVAFGLGEGDSATEPHHDILSKLHVPLSNEAVVNTHTHRVVLKM